MSVEMQPERVHPPRPSALVLGSAGLENHRRLAWPLAITIHLVTKTSHIFLPLPNPGELGPSRPHSYAGYYQWLQLHRKLKAVSMGPAQVNMAIR